MQGGNRLIVACDDNFGAWLQVVNDLRKVGLYVFQRNVLLHSDAPFGEHSKKLFEKMGLTC